MLIPFWGRGTITDNVLILLGDDLNGNGAAICDIFVAARPFGFKSGLSYLAQFEFLDAAF